MSEEKSSSNRQQRLSGVALHHEERSVGVVRLPISRQNDFIRDFNQTYAPIAMKLVPTLDEAQQKTPEN